MGNQLAPPFAIVFMHCVETRMLETATLQPSLYARYIDDTILIYCSAALQVFIAHCNSQHPNIKFTYESSENGPVPFLDVRFEVTPDDGTITHRLYRKPSDSGVNVDFHSQVPRSVKYAVGKQHFVRARKNSFSPAQACESLGMTKKLLRRINYPEAIIEEISQKSCHTAQSREPKKMPLY